MPDEHSRVRPSSAGESLSSDVEKTASQQLQLSLHLQRKLEEDVARIFDESIYSDIELVSGKLKICTHSCILKARTHTFYNKLETILHVNIARNTFDEIYSFISDVYTECNIHHQESEIISYLDNNLGESIKGPTNDESDVFFTPKSTSPFLEKQSKKIISSSPSTDLTKEYYALVPIDGNLLDKELIEQDVIADAFRSIIKTQNQGKKTVLQRSKPTSLSLSTSNIPKFEKSSKSCDLHDSNAHISSNIEKNIQKKNDDSNQVPLISDHTVKSTSAWKSDSDRIQNVTCSPDSLITDEASSSSDYLSAAYTCSPVASTGFLPQLNVGDTFTRMEHMFTRSDSGLDNTGMVESLNSHKDITVTDVSLSESTLHDLSTNDANNLHKSLSSPLFQRDQTPILKAGTSLLATACTSLERVDSDDVSQIIHEKNKDSISTKSSKEEKQRQNEEIVILESSSLSSETGSWESVFPPRLAERELCEKFLSKERQCYRNFANENVTDVGFPNSENKSAYSSTSCFIDAASLLDEEDITYKSQTNITEIKNNIFEIIPVKSQPLPCTTAKPDISPNDWSESNDNEDSLEQGDNKDSNLMQKDISPTIFEMTPITEDSLCTNPFENIKQSNSNYDSQVAQDLTEKHQSTMESFLNPIITPNNSMMSLKSTSLKQYESAVNLSDSAVLERDGHNNVKGVKYNESSPIISGGVSIDDHLPLIGNHAGSPLSRRNIENIPIVSGAFVPYEEEKDTVKPVKSSSASSWTVDMSGSSKLDVDLTSTNINHKKPRDKACELLKADSKCNSLENCNRSRSSVDSDSSERSSHKFYIDLSSLPDSLPHEKCIDKNVIEKKNMFSIFIDFGDNSLRKEMPARLSSSLNSKQTKNIDTSTVKHATNEFEKYESLCNDSNMSISEIIGFRKNVEENTKVEREVELMTNISAPILEEVSAEEYSSDLFVKLSDLDKPVAKTNNSVNLKESKVIDARMTRSIPDNSWSRQNNSMTSRSIEVISSFHSENALSLNRLFPHLKNEFSRSMPGSLSSRTRSPLRLATSTSTADVDEQASDVSELSSVQSSMCRSVVENSTTDETSQTSINLIGNCQSRLGQDLLRMFLEEIAPDVIVEVSGRRIKAHKCILASRCQYFAGILSGGWVESAGNVISLPPFSFNVVHFALCHIYSGVSSIPDTISIVELATIADMLGLEGLKEAIMFTLKAKYCHHFHKPCAVCIAGVLECFPLTSVYGLDDLYRKCLKWITKYFAQVWPTKPFATLPSELLDKCYQQHVVNFTPESVVETVFGCGITVSCLVRCRWAESVARLCRRLVTAAAQFAARRLVDVVRAVSALPAAAPPHARQALDDCVTAAIECAAPDLVCDAYAFLSAHVRDTRSSKPDLICDRNDNLLHVQAPVWRLQCESALVRAAPRVVATRAFKDLSPQLRKRLRDLGCIMYGAQANQTALPLQDRKLKSVCHPKTNSKNTPHQSESLGIDHVRASFVPYSSKPAKIGSTNIVNSNNDLRDNKKYFRVKDPPVIRTTKAQEERAKFNLTKNRNQSRERWFGSNSTVVNLKPKTQANNKCDEKKASSKMKSSSECSQSSTGRARGPRPRTADPSSDSLCDSQASNIYATYTKTKHTTKGSVELVKKPRYNNAATNKQKTKIPVYINKNSKTYVAENGNSECHISKSYAATRNDTRERSNESVKALYRNKDDDGMCPPVSLMNATKSSSAKIVPKVSKDWPKNKSTQKTPTRSSKVEEMPVSDIPVMERSSTLLKDKPTFGDAKITNIDID